MIVLHHCHQSRSMRVLWLLHELGVDFDLEIHAFDRSLLAPEYISLSPAGRVPALELDGEVLFESGAILQVLATRYADVGLARTPDELDWADWLVWLHFGETLTQSLAALTLQYVMLRDPAMRSRPVIKIETARVRRCLDAIEARLSTPIENRDYLLTSGFSAADIAVGQAVWIAQRFTSLSGHPETAAWLARLTERPAFQASLPPPGADLIYTHDVYELPDA